MGYIDNCRVGGTYLSIRKSSFRPSQILSSSRRDLWVPLSGPHNWKRAMKQHQIHFLYHSLTFFFLFLNSFTLSHVEEGYFGLAFRSLSFIFFLSNSRRFSLCFEVLNVVPSNVSSIKLTYKYYVSHFLHVNMKLSMTLKSFSQNKKNSTLSHVHTSHLRTET